ncbi:extensin-like domain-containing protein [Pseudogemmobacter sp. W21_MBD1_M6]|uniref:extensin-like domain-containing protein n=1 Tax=Pseudogemmobacter sp. W21_MBD1_M6 TaxID=3240271 RepID=UPI003F9AF522
MRRLLISLVLTCLPAGQIWASAPDISAVPKPRPDMLSGAQLDDVAPVMGALTPVAVKPVLSGLPGLQSSLRPVGRPAIVKSLVMASVRTKPSTAIVLGSKGAVCGDPAIRGQALAPIVGRIKGCGLDAPVKVTAVDGVALSMAATMDCATAKALKSWVVKGAKPAVGKTGGGIKSLQIMGSYSCRARNNQKGEKISEHGRGKAIDIGAINLVDGTSISVLKGWRDPKQGKILAKMHKGACGPFGTVLGPKANAFHQDHFHFDTARYRGSNYCR